MEIALSTCCLIPGIYLAYTDWTKRLLYDYVTIPMTLLGLFFCVFIFHNTSSALWGFGVAFGLMWLIALMGGTGGGDVKLAGALGIWFGFPNILSVLFIGCVLGIIYGFYILINKGKLKERLHYLLSFIKSRISRDDEATKMYAEKLNDEEYGIPFGTFLILGAWIYFLFINFVVSL